MRSTYSRALPRAWQPVARVFAAIGDEHRQRILLMFERDERLTIGAIVAASTLSRTAVAHHLARAARGGRAQGREGRPRGLVPAPIRRRCARRSTRSRIT
jgi:DNA-binding transcriptional ArsR family regulator